MLLKINSSEIQENRYKLTTIPNIASLRTLRAMYEMVIKKSSK